VAEVDLLQALRQFNVHWETGTVSELIRRSPHVRRSFAHLRRRLPELPFELLAGPRQVGKTTLMGHLMADLLQAGTPPERILYVPLDYPSLELEMQGHLAPLIKVYERFVLKEQLGKSPDLVYIFLDEIQSLPAWGQELKALHDAYHPRVRVLATGSSSAALLNPANADLPGRVDRSHIHPLKFSEVVHNALPATEAVHEAARSVRQAFAQADAATRSQLAAALESLYRLAIPFEADLQRQLDVYLVRGGYPATQQPMDDQAAFRFLENAIDTVISKDLKLYERIRKPGSFRAFLAKLAKEHGGKFVSAHYAKDLQLDKETPAAWKVVAEELFLVHQLPQLNASFAVIPGRADKAYIQDPGIRAFLAAASRISDLETSGGIGHVVEGVLFDHLRRLQFNTLGNRNGRIGYWDKPELDFIVELPKTFLAIECKYRNAPGSATKRLRDVTEGRDVIALAVTRNRFDLTGDVLEVPLWLFLLVA